MDGTVGGTFSYVGYDASSSAGSFTDVSGVGLLDIVDNAIDPDG